MGAAVAITRLPTQSSIMGGNYLGAGIALGAGTDLPPHRRTAHGRDDAGRAPSLTKVAAIDTRAGN